MIFRKTLCTLLLMAAIGSVNCRKTESKSEYEVISGKPISVAESYVNSFGALATVLDVNGRKILASHSISPVPVSGVAKANRKYAEAIALIQSEISDGDTEEIELTGIRAENGFEIKRIKANGYSLDL